MRYRQLIIAAAVALAAVALAACGSSNNDKSSTSSSGGGGGGGDAKKIALLLPETKTTRYEAKDRPLFTAKVKAICPKCTILYSNASQDASKQQQQAEAAITNGADVLVLEPVDVADDPSLRLDDRLPALGHRHRD
jgi:D-xylose transport system substrate-binding protein